MKYRFFAVAFTVVLAGCGGGGGSDVGVESTPPVDTEVLDTEHLKVINAAYARDRSITGAGVTVAVIDSGVNELHEEFAGKILNQNSASFSSPTEVYTLEEIESMGLSGNDFTDAIKTGPQKDVQGHGTHVTSLVWGENVGTAAGADLLMLDVYQEFTPNAVAAKGLIGDLAGFGVSFANASLTGVDYYENSEFLNTRPVFAPLDTGDIGWIVAAGNFNLNLTEVFVTNPVNCTNLTQEERDRDLTCSYVFDATSHDMLVKDSLLANNVLYVGSIDDATLAISVYDVVNGHQLASNVPGSDPDIQSRWLTAPGSLITGPFFDNNTDYFQVSGTSQSAPLVTGAAALVKSQFPTLTNEAVLQILLDTANRNFEGYDPALYGQGILDIEAALKVDASTYPQVGGAL